MDHHHIHGRTRSSRRPLLALAGALTGALVALAPTAALAHGDEGEITVLSAEESGPLSIAIEVGVVHADDQHLAEDATVRASANSGSTEVEAVELERAAGGGSSVYSGEIRVPTAGDWSVRIESENPAATAASVVSVVGAAPPVPTSEVAPTTTTLLLENGLTDTDAEEGAAADEAGTEDDGLSSVVIALGVVGLLVLAAAGFVLFRRRDTA